MGRIRKHKTAPVVPKTPEELERMRTAGRMLAEVHAGLKEILKPGISTLDIDTEGERLIRALGAEPNFKNYQGYPASICVSVNDEVVHGIPNAEHILEEGDIVSLDCGLVYNGYHSDAARTWGIGQIHPRAAKLIEDTRNSFFAGAAKALAGGHLYDISNAVAAYLAPGGYGIVKDLTGHGIGKALHEEPVIPNYRIPFGRGLVLQEGMTLCVEPMVTLGSWRVYWEDDGWTVRTWDGAPAAHYENTLAVREGQLPELLTLLPDEKVPEELFRSFQSR